MSHNVLRNKKIFRKLGTSQKEQQQNNYSISMKAGDGLLFLGISFVNQIVTTTEYFLVIQPKKPEKTK